MVLNERLLGMRAFGCPATALRTAALPRFPYLPTAAGHCIYTVNSSRPCIHGSITAVNGSRPYIHVRTMRQYSTQSSSPVPTRTHHAAAQAALTCWSRRIAGALTTVLHTSSHVVLLRAAHTGLDEGHASTDAAGVGSAPRAPTDAHASAVPGSVGGTPAAAAPPASGHHGQAQKP